MKLKAAALVLAGTLAGMAIAHLGPQFGLTGATTEEVQTLSIGKAVPGSDESNLEEPLPANSSESEDGISTSATVALGANSTDAVLERIEGEDTSIDELEFRREQHEIEMVAYEEEIRRLDEEGLADYRPDPDAPMDLTPEEQLARDQRNIEDYLWEVEVEAFAAPGGQSPED